MRAAPFLRAAGWLLLILPFVPLRSLFGDPPGTGWLLEPSEWLLGLFTFVAAGWLAARIFPDAVDRAAALVVGALGRGPERIFRAATLAALAALLALASFGAFSRRPLLIDSIIQLFQGKIFATGAAAAPAPPYEAFFSTQHMVVDGARWYSQYPPGHPGVLAVGTWLGAPWLIPILMTLAAAWLIADVAKRAFGEPTGRLTLVLLVIAPFFWFMGASYMNHVSALLFIALFVWLFQRWESAVTARAGAAVSASATAASAGLDRRPVLGAGGGGPRRVALGRVALAGAALGLAFLSRPLTALAVGAAFLVPALRAAGRRWAPAGLAGAAGFAAVASLYPLFNAATTGDPFTPGYVKLWGADHGLGFHETPWGDVHTPLTGLRNELVDLGLLNGFLFEWPIPALLLLGGFLAFGRETGGWVARLTLAFFAIPIAYFFYWHRDAFLGPRYLYEGLVFLIPLLAWSLVRLHRSLSGVRVRWLGGVRAGTLLSATIGLAVLYSVAYGIPSRYRIYASGMASLKLDLVREAEAAGADEGLVFVAVSWGNRMISRARGAGASASVVERVYRRSDHCELEETVARAEAEGWSGDRLDASLVALLRAPGELETREDLNRDQTLRLAPGRSLTERCRREVLYDRADYTNYSPHLAANDPDLRGRFVFARDLGDQNAKLAALYPDKPAYLYRPGRLVRIR